MDISWIICFIALAVAIASVVALLMVIRNQPESNQDALLESRMEQMLMPLKEKLETFHSTVIQTHAMQTKDRADLQAQIRQLVSVNQTLGKEAHQLSTALKNDNKKQGDWGELHLITLLEKGGLQAGIHFQVQVTHRKDGTIIRNKAGELLRPDVVIYLPDGKMIIVDAKTSLKAYMNYQSEEDVDKRKTAAKRLLSSMRRHIYELSEKNYPEALPGACEQVLMYIPVENAYLLAMQEEPELWKYAFERKVTMVTATHLFAVVQLLGQLWRQDAQEKNVQNIAAEGGKLYDKLIVFLNYFTKIEDTIRTLQNRYNDAKKSLSDGNGNLLQRAEKLRAMGAKTYKRLPQEYLDMAEEAADEPERPAK